MVNTEQQQDSAQQCPRVPPPDLPKPGAFVVYDFRGDVVKAEVAARPKDQPIKLLQWNIERGYKLPQIIEELKTLDADVLALQEIDIHCERSAWKDTGLAIAKALGLQYVFLCEFEELWSPVRDADAQGGGVHGNAILSKFDISDWVAVEHGHHPVDWEAPQHKLCQKEPRHGKRLTLAATVKTNQGPLLVYCAHLEVFCGMLARMRQFSDIFAHVKRCDAAGGPRHQAILGDLNTQANSLARLSPNYCTDHMRWWSLGWFEAEIWDKHVFGFKEDPTNPQHYDRWLTRQGLDAETATTLTNPGFVDPWNPRRDITIDLIKYRWLGMHLMTGKLDWVLLRKCKKERYTRQVGSKYYQPHLIPKYVEYKRKAARNRKPGSKSLLTTASGFPPVTIARQAQVVNKSMGNDLYDKSDHKWLLAEVLLE